jgi:hypothetical protein
MEEKGWDTDGRNLKGQLLLLRFKSEMTVVVTGCTWEDGREKDDCQVVGQW